MGSETKTVQHGARCKTNEVVIKAIRKDEELLQDILQHESSEDLHIWWLGQSGYLLQHKGKRALIDPYLSDSLTKKYATTDKPHVRISERVIDPSMLPMIDLVSSSHNHTDHLDAETLIPVLEKNPDCKIIIPEANRAFVCNRLKVALDKPIGLNDGMSHDEGWIHLTALPAAHNEVDRDKLGNCCYLGYIFKIGGLNIYHSGDTLLYDGMHELIRHHQPHIALLPINGNDPSRKVAGNLSANEAVRLAKECNIPFLIPCHYDLFEFNTADVNEFIQLSKESEQKILVLDLGGKFCVRELQTVQE
jgi:L-ascorbate metabolism protein UlaG (beta-lactamase superfamily)